MNTIGFSNNRLIFYFSIQKTKNWIDYLPTENWLVMPICNNKDRDLIDSVAHACIDRNVEYMCAVGKECEWVHDWFDEIIVERILKIGKYNNAQVDLEKGPMTTWHQEFDEGFWFAINCAFGGDRIINKIICLDLTNIDHKGRLVKLLNKINQSWAPDD